QGKTAIEADRLSVAEWLDRRRVRGRARWLISSVIGGYASQPVEELSLLQHLWWMASYRRNFTALRTGSACYLAEGAQEVARRLAARLPEPPTLETPVDSIEQEGSSQVSIGSDGRVVCRARAAIVAVPIPTLGRIRFEPPLPESQADWVAAVRYGHLTKLGAAAISEVPERHRSVVGGEPIFWSARMESELVGYGLRPARGRAPDELLAQLAASFGLRPDEIRGEAVDWSDEPFTGGSYIAFAPGQITRLGEGLAQAHGLVRFAGAERSTKPQSMEGALESGSRVGAETHSALRESRRPAEVL
ncbi:MAG: flavin monoamine oxidase family protein, partial [Gaiellaceae bacterium]